MSATTHGPHCFSPEGVLWCGWPELHTRKCIEAECRRMAREGWNLCDSHAQQHLDCWSGIKPTEAQPELPRWKPVPA